MCKKNKNVHCLFCSLENRILFDLLRLLCPDDAGDDDDLFVYIEKIFRWREWDEWEEIVADAWMCASVCIYAYVCV